MNLVFSTKEHFIPFRSRAKYTFSKKLFIFYLQYMLEKYVYLFSWRRNESVSNWVFRQFSPNSKKENSCIYVAYIWTFHEPFAFKSWLRRFFKGYLNTELMFCGNTGASEVNLFGTCMWFEEIRSPVMDFSITGTKLYKYRTFTMADI